MAPLTLLFIVVIVFQFGLNYLILAGGNYRKQTNLWFAGMNTSLIVWILTIILANIDFNSESLSLFISRLSFASIFTFTFFLYFFAKTFSAVPLRIPRVFHWYMIASTLFWAVVIFITDQVVRGVIRVEDRFDVDRSGDLYIHFLVFTLLHLGVSIVVLGLKTLKADAKERPKLKIVLFGLVLISIIVVITNAIIPLLTGTTESSSYGPLAIIIWLSVIFYNIHQNQFLDTRLILGRFFYYAILGVLAYVSFYVFSFITLVLFGSIYEPGSYIIGIFNAAVFVLGFDAARKFFQEQITLRLINPGFNPLEIIDQFNGEISTTLDLKDVADQTMSVLAKTIRPDRLGVIVSPNDSNNNWRSFEHKSKEASVFQVQDFKVLNGFWDGTNTRPIVFDDLEYDTQGLFRTMPNMIEQVRTLMQKYELKVIYPLIENEEVSGMLLLGRKEADSPYSTQDLKFLESLASITGLAINRALLYQETQQFNIELQKQVEKATKELKVKNSSLEDALTKLEEIRRQERDMIDVMGHELRTPISIVRNALLVMDSKYKKHGEIPKETLEKYLEMAIESVRRELTLIETLLSATKVEGNRIQLHLTKIDMKDVIDDSLEALRRDAQEKGLTINYDPPQHEIIAYADRVRTQEVMDNFLSNAIKYTPRGQITISVGEDDGFAWISVKDSGVGISREDIKKLGKKFFRAQPHYSAEDGARPSGTGLGLYVTFELIDVMNGKRDIQSEIGKGSTFSFYLPSYTEQEDTQIDQTFMTNPALAKETIDNIAGKKVERSDRYTVVSIEPDPAQS